MQVRAKGSQYKSLKLRQNIVCSMNFSSKTRPRKLINNELENKLGTANKFIFVQDFEKAERIVVVGKIKGEEFIASQVLMKCPSKYNKAGEEEGKNSINGSQRPQ
jgi:hypothetical protein